MGKRGPKPRPTLLKKLHGTYRADRHDHGPEPDAPGLLLEPPDWLPERLGVRFREIIATAPRHLLRRWDMAAVAAFVIAEGQLIDATKALEEPGAAWLIDYDAARKVAVTNKLRDLQRKAMESMRHWVDRLGFAPASRSALRLDEGYDEREDPGAWRWRGMFEDAKRNQVQMKAAYARQRARLELVKETSDADAGPETQAAVEGEVEERAAEAVEPVPPGVPPEAIGE
jgi:P27 family predicted phage terminase small subunit